ncbi:unnamed protein product [Rotaria socialis]
MLTELKRKDLCLGTRDLAMLNEFVSLLVLIGEATTVTQAQNTPSIRDAPVPVFTGPVDQYNTGHQYYWFSTSKLIIS